jgi:hypothetical protein
MLESLRLRLNDNVPKTGHEYYDTLTATKFRIVSVRKSDIEIERGETEIPIDREHFLKGYRLGFIQHAPKCDYCENQH